MTDAESSRSDVRQGSQQDNEGGAEREHIHIFIRRFAVGREEVVVQEKSHSVRGIDLEGQRHAGPKVKPPAEGTVLPARFSFG